MLYLTVLHCHVAVGAAVPKRAPLFLEGDEVPYGHHGVVRHIEVEQFHTGEGVESIQLTRRAGEVFSHKKAICGDKSRIKVFLNYYLEGKHFLKSHSLKSVLVVFYL